VRYVAREGYLTERRWFKWADAEVAGKKGRESAGFLIEGGSMKKLFTLFMFALFAVAPMAKADDTATAGSTDVVTCESATQTVSDLTAAKQNAIDGLNNRISKAQTRIQSWNDKTVSLQSRMDSTSAAISSLNDRMAASTDDAEKAKLQARIDKKSAALAKLQARKDAVPGAISKLQAKIDAWTLRIPTVTAKFDAKIAKAMATQEGVCGSSAGSDPSAGTAQ